MAATSSNRPSEGRYSQQKLLAWSPVITPLKSIVFFLAVGASFIPSGLYLMSTMNTQWEKTIVYDSSSTMDVSCSISAANAGKACPAVTVTLTQDVDGPIYVYYELGNFYQNQRKYAQSFYLTQLEGVYVEPTDTYMKSACDPLTLNGTQLRNPCGLVAASFFTDKFTLSSGSSSPTTVSMSEKNIAWSYDKDFSFLQPAGFRKTQGYATQQTCSAVGLGTDCKEYVSQTDGQYYYYWYPRDASTYYLYEMYPNNISPLDGVTDEHFIVWMKISALPKFRKLYGKISRTSGGSNSFKKGDVLTFSITANYPVASFSGTKALVLSTEGPFGAPNPSVGLAYLICGCVCGGLGLLFLLTQLIRPRPPGSKEMFHWD